MLCYIVRVFTSSGVNASRMCNGNIIYLSVTLKLLHRKGQELTNSHMHLKSALEEESA
jgi:hypothetical protein